MAVSILLPLLIGSIVSGLAGAGASIAGSAINAKSQKETNEQNIEMQKQINAQSQYNAEHAHQIEMQDLANAGLNPVLTATGGNGAPLASLDAPKAQAPQVDLSGVSTALNGMMNTMTMMALLNEKNHLLTEQTNILRDKADVYSKLSGSKIKMNNEKLNYYKRLGEAYANSAENIAKERSFRSYYMSGNRRIRFTKFDDYHY